LIPNDPHGKIVMDRPPDARNSTGTNGLCMKEMRMKKHCFQVLLMAACLSSSAVWAEVSELRVPLGAGGFGFLPLHIMKTHNLIEKQADKQGLKVKVNWANVGGPSAMIDALISGSADFISAGPPSFLILWDKTRTNVGVKGVAAMSSMPMTLNTKAEHLKSVDDLRGSDKVAVTSVKSSIPSIVMQMYAVKKYGKDQVFRFDPFTVSMNHGDAATALLSGNASITGHFASAPLDQIERKSPGVRSIMNSDEVMGGSTTFTMISTTRKFQERNPKVYSAFVNALKEAQDMIRQNKQSAAQVLIDSMGGPGKWSLSDMMAMLNDPAIKYTTNPENVMKYAFFMHDIGSLKNRPTSIQELFFPGIDLQNGH
jgi:NitT/TauT family transport system substrate-binding protein